MRALAVAVVFGFLNLPVAYAQAMTFSLAVGDPECRECRLVIADGVIEADTGAKLEAFAKSTPLFSEDVVVLRSPGGSLLGGMYLGRVVRRLGLSTHVGSINTLTGEPRDCASACAYAFLGGVKRSIAEDGRIGLHRFLVVSDRLVSAGSAVEGIQGVLADLFVYVEEMGVSKDFAAIATATASDSITWPTYSTLGMLHAINAATPYAAPEWKRYGRSATLIYTSAVRADGTVDRFMLECELGFQKRPVRMIYSTETMRTLSRETPDFFEVTATLVGNTGVRGSGFHDNQPVFTRSGQNLQVDFSVDARQLMALVETSTTARIRFVGDDKFVAAFGQTEPIVPLANLAPLLRSELRMCEH